MENYKKLIIAPHADDDVLCCGGILDKDSFVYYCGIDESKVASDKEHRIGMKAIMAEIKNVSKFLGFNYSINLKAKVNNYKISDFILEFEKLINTIKPEMVFIPSYKTFNQDHLIVYNAAKIALRQHDKNFFVKKILICEQPSSILSETSPLTPNYFIPIDIKRKTKAYSLYPSQIRGPRSMDLLRAIAKIRGKQSNYKNAEAFFIERFVE